MVIFSGYIFWPLYASSLLPIQNPMLIELRGHRDTPTSLPVHSLLPSFPSFPRFSTFLLHIPLRSSSLGTRPYWKKSTSYGRRGTEKGRKRETAEPILSVCLSVWSRLFSRASIRRCLFFLILYFSVAARTVRRQSSIREMDGRMNLLERLFGCV